MCSKLTWSHNRLIMRVENPKVRAYYLREAAEQMWSVRQLERNIHSHYYERLLNTPGNAELPAPETQTSADFIKDPYVLEFLNLPERAGHSEKNLENALIENLQLFDDLKRNPDDNPTVGIILCEAKDETVVRYSVLQSSEQLFASKYRLVLPTEQELAAEIDRERRLLMEYVKNSGKLIGGKIKGGGV